MKRRIFPAFMFACLLMLAGCNHAPGFYNEAPFEADIQETPDCVGAAAPASETEPETEELCLPENLPEVLASAGDVDGSGGYLMIGAMPEADIALYCDNLEERNSAYIRYGEHFQRFGQEAWTDPAVLPELDWRDWDEDGTMELVVKYLRHEGTFFDGESVSPGLVYELVVYKWDETRWTDIHFSSGGPPQTVK